MKGRKRERENPCFICGHYHNYEAGEPCAVCGHAPACAAEPQGPTVGAFPTEVVPGFLYLGSYDHASRSELLKAMGIKRILNVRPPRRTAHTPRSSTHARTHGRWDSTGAAWRGVARRFGASLGTVVGLLSRWRLCCGSRLPQPTDGARLSEPVPQHVHVSHGERAAARAQGGAPGRVYRLHRCAQNTPLVAERACTRGRRVGSPL